MTNLAFAAACVQARSARRDFFGQLLSAYLAAGRHPAETTDKDLTALAELALRAEAIFDKKLLEEET